MAERPSPRPIAIIRRITGARHEHRPRLAVNRFGDRRGGGRLLASIAARTGLGARVARHTIGFGQSLWPLRSRRYMSHFGLGMVLRRRRIRRPLERPPRQFTWPLSRALNVDASDGRSIDVVGFNERFHGADLEPIEAAFDETAVPEDAIDFDDLVATPDEAILARHEAFLGLPLVASRGAQTGSIARRQAGSERTAIRSDRAPLPLVPRVVEGARTPPATDGIEMSGDFSGGATDASDALVLHRFARQRAVETFADGQFASPGDAGADASPGAAGRGRLRGGPQSGPRVAGGLHALRSMVTPEPHLGSGPSVDFATSVVARHLTAGEGAARPAPASRFAPVMLALTRRSAASRRTPGGMEQAATQLVWPSAASGSAPVSVESPAAPVERSPRRFAVTTSGGSPSILAGRLVARPATAELARFLDESGFGESGAYRVAEPGDSFGVTPGAITSIGDRAVAWSAALGHETLADASRPWRGYGRLAMPAETDRLRDGDVLGPEPSIGRFLRGALGAEHPWLSRISPFAGGEQSDALPSTMRRMRATAADLILRRVPAIATRSMLGTETIRQMHWPVTPVGALTAAQPPSSGASAVSSFDFSEPAAAGGPLQATSGRVRRAMRVEPIAAPLSPQYPISSLAAPMAEVGPASSAWSVLSGTAAVARAAAPAMPGEAASGYAPVPPELVPAFSAQRAEHAVWGESLAVGSPPPFLAVDPSGASFVEARRSMAGVLQRLAFADAWRGREHGGARSSEQLPAGETGGPLPLGRSRSDASVQFRSGSGQSIHESSPSGFWPGMTAPPQPRGAAGFVDGWSTPALPLSTFHQRTEDLVALGAIGRTSGDPVVLRSTRRGAVGVADVDQGVTFSPLFAGAWPTRATDHMVLQRRARTRLHDSTVSAGRAGGATIRGIDGMGAGLAESTPTRAMPVSRMMPTPWSTEPSLPVVRAWRRSMATTSAGSAAASPVASWPVFRSARPDAVEPGAADRSIAAEAMAASQGQALPPLVRRSMEHLFRMDLANVRVHTGTQAARATGAVAARAMAHGADIYLPGGVGESPGGADMPLLAHELTHVAHHHGHRPPTAMPPLTLARRSAPEEHDADRIERLVADAVQDQSTVQPEAQREPAAELTLARRPAPITIMRAEVDAPSDDSTTSAVSGASPSSTDGSTNQPDKTEQIKQTDKLAEEIFRRLERRLVVARERGGHRW